MTCKKCGAEIPDGSVFCTECGAPVQEEPVQNEPAQEPVQQPEYIPVQDQGYTPVQPAANDPALNATPILILGIVSLCIPALGALILGIICLKKVKQYQEAGGVLAGKAKIGKILGTIGLVYGIVSCAAAVLFLIVYVIIVVIIGGGAVLSGLSSSGYNYY